jgi:uncharacterized Zn finger protein
MAGRGWDDPWQRFPASKPLPVEGGVTTSRQRGAMATTWWSRRFVEVLESFGLGTRMQRGRRYARTGQVIELEVGAGMAAAQVQGSRARPYLVTIGVDVPDDERWEAIVAAMRAKVGFVARLLDGEVPPDLEAVFAGAGARLLPAAWSDLRCRCSCPDGENPCKHIAAVLYLLADRLDTDPWLVLALRGRERAELLEALTAAPPGPPSGAAAAGVEVAPWWPFGPGPVTVEGTATDLPLDTPRPEASAAVLDAMGPLPVELGPGLPFVDALRRVYELFG